MLFFYLFARKKLLLDKKKNSKKKKKDNIEKLSVANFHYIIQSVWKEIES